MKGGGSLYELVKPRSFEQTDNLLLLASRFFLNFWNGSLETMKGVSNDSWLKESLIRGFVFNHVRV